MFRKPARTHWKHTFNFSMVCAAAAAAAAAVVVQDQMTWAAEQIGVKDSMFFEEGKAWGRSRRLISPNLNGHNVAAMIPVMAKVQDILQLVLASLNHGDANLTICTESYYVCACRVWFVDLLAFWLLPEYAKPPSLSRLDVFVIERSLICSHARLLCTYLPTPSQRP